MRAGTGSDKKDGRKNAGFSLMELLVVLSIIMTMTGITVISMGSYRGKVTERQARNVADELLLARSAQQTRPGDFTAGLVQEEHVWIVVINRTAEGASGPSEYDRQELGSANSLRITDGEGKSLGEDGSGYFMTWRFDRESGACVEGAGSIMLSGSGKTYRLTVYGPTGRAEVRTVYGVIDGEQGE